MRKMVKVWISDFRLPISGLVPSRMVWWHSYKF
jgi:hypothetical protein